jgi:hypothetical protein
VESSAARTPKLRDELLLRCGPMPDSYATWASLYATNGGGGGGVAVRRQWLEGLPTWSMTWHKSVCMGFRPSTWPIM